MYIVDTDVCIYVQISWKHFLQLCILVQETLYTFYSEISYRYNREVHILYRYAFRLYQLTPNITFCSPNGIGVRRVNSTTRNALGPDITRSMARPVSFLINLKIASNQNKTIKDTEKKRKYKTKKIYKLAKITKWKIMSIRYSESCLYLLIIGLFLFKY